MERWNKLGLTLLLAAGLTACGGESAVSEPPSESPTPAVVETSPAETPEAVTFDTVYDGLVERTAALAAGRVNMGEETPAQGETGIWEALLSGGAVGYYMGDLSGDGVPELAIVCAGGNEDPCLGREVLALYTAVDGAPLLTFEGVARSSYAWLGDGRFLYRGSAGMGYSLFGVYALSADGAELVCEDLWFTWEKEESADGVGYYHNTTGLWDPEQAEELDLTAEEFWRTAEELESREQDLELTPFPGRTEPVQVEWQPEGDTDWAFSFTADTTEYSAPVRFTAERELENFKFLSLLPVMDEEGTLSFETETLFSLKTLPPEQPLVVELTFYGDTPCYGISYMDNGAEHRMALDMSGMDGSLFLWEF